jgi:hypothetical protein
MPRAGKPEPAPVGSGALFLLFGPEKCGGPVFLFSLFHFPANDTAKIKALILFMELPRNLKPRIIPNHQGYFDV